MKQILIAFVITGIVSACQGETTVGPATNKPNAIAPVVEYSDETTADDEDDSDDDAGARLGTTTPKGKVYIQYKPVNEGLCALQGVFQLKDYYWLSGTPVRADFVATDENHVDTVKMAALIAAGRVKYTLLKHKGVSPVKLRTLATGFHLLTDGGGNPIGINVVENDAATRPLLWFNGNYSVSPQNAIIRITLKNYPADYDLKWWFLGNDLMDPSLTGDEIAALFTDDGSASDYDAGFVSMQPKKSRSFRAPTGIAWVVVKTPRNTYQGVRINVGLKKTTSLTFTAPVAN